MKKTTAFFIIGFIISFAYLSACISDKKSSPEAAIRKDIQHDISQLEKYLQDSLLPSAEQGANGEIIQRQFIKTRLLYKRLEWVAEYFMPSTTRFVNGPPLPEIEFEENRIKDPEGLQVLEALLFPEALHDSKAEIIRQIKFLQSNCIRYRDYFNTIEPDPVQIFDAARLQVFRIITLGISGFDAPLAQSSMHEAKESLDALQKALRHYTGNSTTDSIIGKATLYLSTHSNFNSFDRLRFITEYANPLSRAITNEQQLLGIPFIAETRLLKPDAATLFDKNAFDPNAYTPDTGYHNNAQKIELGRQLFYNTLLSGNNSRSCASCHQPEKAFTDGLAKSTSLDGGRLIRRNTPTLLNAALQPAQFYDLRVTVLENQATDVINNIDEMHGSMDDAADKLWKDPNYRMLFNKTFPDAINGIKPFHIQHALASYIRSLVKLNSRFDQYMQGDAGALNDEEKSGFNLFMGKAKCGTCHFMPLFSGVVPPAFVKIETEVIGVPDPSLKNIDKDPGRYETGQMEPFRNAFKTTTVRNTALTAPYMHNGVFNTLEEVMDFYNKGGGAGMGFTVNNQTLPFDKLNLTIEEQKLIIAFIKALNDK